MIRIIRLFVVGFCMGAADIVPGVSGGTMAFILGVYRELVESIRRFASPELWKPLLRGDIKIVVQKSNWLFLCSLAAGILCAVATLSHWLEQALQHHPIYVWCFFFGLVLASAALIARRIHTINASAILYFIAGIAVAYWIVGLVPTETSNTPGLLMLSGAIAICAMILPGISGSFLLVILGKYEFILRAVNTRDVVSLSYVALGASGGILAFSHVLTWLLNRYHDLVIAFLTGLMLGSLRKIWPWKEVELNVLPEPSVQLAWQIGLMVIGCIAVVILEDVAEGDD